MLVLKALFTDNNHYGETLICGDEFVEAISWLYDDDQSNSIEDYCLDSKMNMPVFMTAVAYFVEAALGPHGKLSVNDLVKKIRTDEHGENNYIFEYSITVVKKENETGYCFKCVDSFKLETIIWAAYLYMDIMANILPEEKKEKYNLKKTILYKILLEQSGLKEQHFLKRHPLWKKNEQTILKFRLELGKHAEELEEEEDDNKEDDSRYEDMTEFNKELKRKVRINLVLKILGIDDFNTYQGDKSKLIKLIALITNDDANGIQTTIYRDIHKLTKRDHGADIKTTNDILKEAGFKQFCLDEPS